MTSPSPAQRDDLLARLDSAMSDGAVTHSDEWTEIAVGLAAALRSQIAETSRLRPALDFADGVKDHAEQMADLLAATLAPKHLVGEHTAANDPWQNALDYAAQARAAAPQPIWTGKTEASDMHPGESYVIERLLVPAGTDVAIIPADEIAGARGGSEQVANEPDPKPAAPQPLWTGTLADLDDWLADPDHRTAVQVAVIPLHSGGVIRRGDAPTITGLGFCPLCHAIHAATHRRPTARRAGRGRS